MPDTTFLDAAKADLEAMQQRHERTLDFDIGANINTVVTEVTAWYRRHWLGRPPDLHGVWLMIAYEYGDDSIAELWLSSLTPAERYGNGLSPILHLSSADRAVVYGDPGDLKLAAIRVTTDPDGALRIEVTRHTDREVRVSYGDLELRGGK